MLIISFSYNYLFIVGYKLGDYVLQKEEVVEVKYFTIEELEHARKIGNTDFTFCNWGEESFYEEMRILREKRKIINEL